MSYTPKPGSAADRAVSYLGRVKGEVCTADLADAIACTPYGLGRTLGRAVDAGLLIKRQHKAGTSAPLFWSLPAESVAEAVAPKPEPATDIPVVQRTVPAAEAGPSGWTPHPLDAAWHPRAANGKDSSALDAGQHADAGPLTINEAAAWKEDTHRGMSGTSEIQPTKAGRWPAGPESAQAPDLEHIAGVAPGPLHPIRLALWSDGTLQIERKTVGGAAELVLLCRDEVRQIAAFLSDPAMGVRGEGD